MSPILSRLILPLLVAMMAVPAASRAAEGEKREAVIVVSGTAERAIAPDMAVVSLGVITLEKTARAALDGNNGTVAAVLRGLREEGIAERDLQTSDFSIQPQYTFPENNDGVQKPPVLSGYQVSNTLTVRVRDLARLGGILDRTVSLGVNQGGEIRFANDNPEKTVEEARSAAVKSAAAKARTLAAAAGVRLGRVVEISENASEPQPRPMMQMARSKQADAVPVAAGENSYSVNVTVTFAIDQ